MSSEEVVDDPTRLEMLHNFRNLLSSYNGFHLLPIKSLLQTQFRIVVFMWFLPLTSFYYLPSLRYWNNRYLFVSIDCILWVNTNTNTLHRVTFALYDLNKKVIISMSDYSLIQDVRMSKVLSIKNQNKKIETFIYSIWNFNR